MSRPPHLSPRRSRRRLAAAAGALALACSPRVEPPALPDVGADVLFFDDFAGAALDRSKWTVTVRGTTVNDELQAYVDETETVAIVHGNEAEGAADGALRLAARWRPGFAATDSTRLDFVSGHVHSEGKFAFTYGTAAARMKLPAGAGLWPAFWILGTGDWPATGEIDVMENVGDPSWTSVALHGEGYSGDTPIVHRQRFPVGTDAADWHVYSVDWLRDALVFRVDGIEVYRATKPLVERYGAWAFDAPKYLIANLAIGGIYPASVNGTRAPYLGLPDSTARLIREGRARVLVDWVRVTRR